jgi:hypothetical protein
MRNAYAFFLFSLFSEIISAHSFDERYDLPIPLEFFLIGGGLVVTLSFLLIVISSKYWPVFEERSSYSTLTISPRFSNGIFFVLRFCGLLCFVAVLLAGFWGSGNPLLNLAPNFVWITWWLGFSISISLIGNFWPLCNPWATLFSISCWLLSSLGFKRTTNNPPLFFPDYLGLYLATGFLLAWSWMEVIYPIAFVPTRVVSIAIVWTLINLSGMYLFGKSVWLQRGDVFSLYFSMLGQFGIFSYSHQRHGLRLRLPGEGVLLDSNSWRQISGIAAFVIAMLAIVLFDGLHGSQAWTLFTQMLQSIGLIELGSDDYLTGTVGLISVWLFFLGLFYISCNISSRFTPATGMQLTNIFSTALIPIAVAYLIAHNFSSLMIQGQSIFFLASDPFGLGWNLFGTADYRPNIGIIDAGTTWYLAVVSIVIGHVIALILNHFLAMRLVGSTRRATLITIPQTLLMIMFTMLSLVIIAEPMTTSEFSLLQELCLSKETP